MDIRNLYGSSLSLFIYILLNFSPTLSLSLTLSRSMIMLANECIAEGESFSDGTDNTKRRMGQFFPSHVLNAFPRGFTNGTVPYSTVQYSTIFYSAVQYSNSNSTVQYSNSNSNSTVQ